MAAPGQIGAAPAKPKRKIAPPPPATDITRARNTKPVASPGAARARRAGDDQNPPMPDRRGRLKVRATAMCYYDLKRRREGDVFFINSESEFSARYMVYVDVATPLKITSAQQALKNKTDEIRGRMRGRRVQGDPKSANETPEEDEADTATTDDDGDDVQA